jgi:hypothetical protein
MDLILLFIHGKFRNKTFKMAVNVVN